MLESRNVGSHEKLLFMKHVFLKKFGRTAQFHEFLEIFQHCTHARIT